MFVKRFSMAVLACLMLSACGGVDPNSPLGQRKTIFKQMLKTNEELGGMLRGRVPFDGARFAEGALQLDQLSHEPWKHFPQVREQDHVLTLPRQRVEGAHGHVDLVAHAMAGDDDLREVLVLGEPADVADRHRRRSAAGGARRQAC